MAARKSQTNIQRVQRKFLRGPVCERVRSFIAVSSWFWYRYPCVQPNDESDDSRAKTFSASLSQFHPRPGVEELNSQLEIQRKFD
jgi:hypothetical protein